MKDLRAYAFRGRHRMMTAGTWVTDLAELGKAICLCPDCEPKFDAKNYHYRKQTRPPFETGVEGECDGCKQTALCKLYLKE